MTAAVLLVEDDPTMAEVVLAYLGRAGYRTRWVADGAEALDQWQRDRPDVVVLDVMLPTLSGLEVLRRRRRTGDDAAVIMLSARGEEEDRLVGLEVGADDYVVKPFSPRELVARVTALLRRGERLGAARLVPTMIEHGPLQLDLQGRSVRCRSREVALTLREYDLLVFLAEHPGETFSKNELLRRVWGWEFGDTSTVTVHVRRLREKIETDPSDPVLITTVGRAGYRLDPATEPTSEPSGRTKGSDHG